MEIFQKKGHTCILTQKDNEPDKIFYQRGWFIVSQLVKQNPKNKDEYDQILKYANIWVNHLYYECEYSEDIMEKLKNMENNLYCC